MPDQKGSESSSPKKFKSSWLSISPNSDFSLSNVPFGVCSFPHAAPTPLLSPRCCTAIGEYAVDLSVLAEAGMLDGVRGLDSPVYTFSRGSLNDFMSRDKSVWVGVRNRLISLFSDDSDGAGRDPDPALRDNSALRSASIRPLSSAKMHLPAVIGDYTDFYSSREHATNVGTMFRGKDNALQPNWLHLPVGYHGRSSTVYVSGTPIRRPCGQLQVDKDDPKKGSSFGPSKLLDFELEVAFFVGGKPNPAGTRLSISQAKERIFGFVLMNDWSARDIQKWEYVPLGPFGSKNFGTTISPWVVTGMALEEYRTATSAGTQSDPKPLEYLQDPTYDSYDVHLEVAIQGPDMKEAGTVCQSNFKNLYWNAPQQLVHHSVTGCVMNPGDLLASGTISGQDESAFGSMLELSWRGSREVKLGQSGEVRKFIRDGDNVVMRGWCGGGEDGGANRVGFGVCEGKVLPADPNLTAAKGAAAAVSTEVPAGGGAVKSRLEGSSRYTDFKLHSYYRSSSSWRVRVALESKCIPYVTVPVNLLKSEQTSSPHADINPMLQVPVLECTDTATNATVRITQSLAIIDFLEEAFPSSGGSLLLLPSSDGGGDPTLRAGIREMAELVNSGVQPLQNLSTFKKIDADSGGAMNGKEFARQMIEKGLVALEKLAESRRNALGAGRAGPFVMGTFAPTLADACVVPQLYNARRFDVDVDKICPTLAEAEKAALGHPWFQRSHPDRQPDSPPTNGGASDANDGAPPAAKRNGDKGRQQEGASDAGRDEEQEKKKARAE